MKNIHILPTDKPSRLSDCHNGIMHLDDVRYLRNYQNIYITNDEEIKKGDWYFTLDSKRVGKSIGVLDGFSPIHKKIILTTDQDLIKDGVQAIDDEFLEWFVKNPSCDFIETVNASTDFEGNFRYYDFIFPKEEPKQETELDVYYRNGIGIIKQETLEEAAERLAKHFNIDFIEGAKWQKDKSYSEEDVINALHSIELKDNKDYSKIYNGMKDWFKKFKK